MMISKTLPSAKEAYVWIWLPGDTQPTPCGRLFQDDQGKAAFHYGHRYLERSNAIPIFEDLPLASEVFSPAGMMEMPASIRDASPDAWGRRVLEATSTGSPQGLGELDYLLRSGSDRIGALDFQASPREYRTRPPVSLPIEELYQAAEALDEGRPISNELEQALIRGSSIGGARPKTLFEESGKHYIAKYSLSRDLIPVNKAESVAMMIAAECGISVAEAAVESVLGKDVLLVERFDRRLTDVGTERRAMVSALTVLGLDEMEARYAGYDLLADRIRQIGKDPARDLRELFSRMTYNVLCGNTDDHARNHAFFWDGSSIELTPAYDVCPQARTGSEASQAMRIHGDRNESTLAACIQAAPASFGLSEAEARQVIGFQIEQIGKCWVAACEEVGLSDRDRSQLFGRQFLNPFVAMGLEEGDPLIDSIRFAKGQVEMVEAKKEAGLTKSIDGELGSSGGFPSEVTSGWKA